MNSKPQLPAGTWTPAIHRALQALIDGTSGNPVAVFDWDHTVINADVSMHVLGRIDATEGTTYVETYHRLCREQGTTVGYPYATTCLAGRRDSDLRALAATTIAAGIASGKLRVRASVHQLIDTLRAAGWDVWVVSASPTQFVQTFAATIGFPAHRVLGMTLRVGDDGLLTEVLEQPAPCMAGKVGAIEHFIGVTPTLVVGDSGGDLAMLHIAHNRLVIAGPEGGGAVEAAREHAWWLQEGWPSDQES